MLLSIDFMVYEISVRYGEACKMLSEKRFELVYVIGLLAIQFGNNWMKKKTGCPRNFSNSIVCKLDKHVILLLINYIAS